MTVSLSDLKGNLTKGYLRTNAYRVIIQDMPDDISTHIFNAQLPSVTADPMLTYHQGREFKTAGMPRWSNWNATIYGTITSDDKLHTYNEFQKWMNSQIGLISNIGNNDFRSYQREIRIIPLLDNRTTQVGEFVLKDAFITEIPPVDVAYESNDAFRFNVVIAFSEATWETGGEVVYGNQEG